MSSPIRGGVDCAKIVVPRDALLAIRQVLRSSLVKDQSILVLAAGWFPFAYNLSRLSFP